GHPRRDPRTGGRHAGADAARSDGRRAPARARADRGRRLPPPRGARPALHVRPRAARRVRAGRGGARRDPPLHRVARRRPGPARCRGGRGHRPRTPARLVPRMRGLGDHPAARRGGEASRASGLVHRGRRPRGRRRRRDGGGTGGRHRRQAAEDRALQQRHQGCRTPFAECSRRRGRSAGRPFRRHPAADRGHPSREGRQAGVRRGRRARRPAAGRVEGRRRRRELDPHHQRRRRAVRVSERLPRRRAVGALRRTRHGLRHRLSVAQLRLRRALRQARGRPAPGTRAGGGADRGPRRHAAGGGERRV
ncbi:MAG: hypothetical protein AVDCRST_MAG53-3563, partial [uncultured Solirubrobacteraceae bacterium]